MNFIKKVIKHNYEILSDPKNEFKKVDNVTFEDILKNYLFSILVVGILAAIISFLFYFLKASYLDVFMNINVKYWRMINYNLGRSTAILFFYFFAGTFLMFIFSLIIRPFLHKVKYVTILKVLFYSVAPLILFSWIPTLNWALLVWSLFIMVIGFKTVKKNQAIKKDSIKMRD